MGPQDRIGRAERVALGVAVVHTVLLFFPPLPPDVKGSLWSYLLAVVAVVTGTLAVRSRVSAITAWWSELDATRRWALVAVAVGALLGTGFALHAVAPDVFARWSHDEGVYQPLTMFAYLSAALVLAAAARSAAREQRWGLRLVSVGFVLLFLEEVDYLGIVGGIVGRVDGTYVGSLHDMLKLVGTGRVPTVAVVAFVGVVLFLPLAAWQIGRLHPWKLVRLVSRSAWTWAALGVALMLTAQAMDLGLVTPVALEELFEVSASLLWLACALELGRRARLPARAAPSNRRVAPTAASSATRASSP